MAKHTKKVKVRADLPDGVEVEDQAVQTSKVPRKSKTKSKKQATETTAPKPKPKPEPVNDVKARANDSGSDSDDDDKEIDNLEFVPLHAGATARKLDDATLKANEARGVIFLGHLPRVLTDADLTEYLRQFGKVLNLRISRNPKTGESRHYAYAEFESRQIADIVVDAMDSYILFEHVLQCHIVEPEDIHPDLFAPSVSVSLAKKIKEQRIARLAPKRDPQSHKQRVKRLIKKDKKRMAKLASLGVDVSNLPSLADAAPKQPLHQVFDE